VVRSSGRGMCPVQAPGSHPPSKESKRELIMDLRKSVMNSRLPSCRSVIWTVSIFLSTIQCHIDTVSTLIIRFKLQIGQVCVLGFNASLVVRLVVLWPVITSQNAVHYVWHGIASCVVSLKRRQIYIGQSGSAFYVCWYYASTAYLLSC